MNDPHVVALFYNVKHSASVDYSDAKPLEHEEKDFKITIENDKACFIMKAHYATEEEARKAVEEYIQVWELDAALQTGPTAFTLEFAYPHIKDRNPPPKSDGFVNCSVTLRSPGGTLRASLAPRRRQYPKPPSAGLKITPDVRSMFDRWAGYRLDKEPLASMAYFCLTVLEASAHPKNGDRKNKTRQPSAARRKAAKDYKIALDALSKIGELSSEKGGRDARKAAGRNTAGSNNDLTPKETRFLEKAVKAMIRQVAAHEYNSAKMSDTIELDDLP